jgi:SAM-dependent methyltransferase
MSDSSPVWAKQILAAPGGGTHLVFDKNNILSEYGEKIGFIKDGIFCFSVESDDPSIVYYDSIDGTHFSERSAEALAMSTLDTKVYHQHLNNWKVSEPGNLLVDVGGGDGRNALPWLTDCQSQVVVIDPIFSSLKRFRDRIAEKNPEWLERLLLIRADARALPLRSECADRVQAIESLYYLNEDYENGLSECVRILKKGASIMLSERDYENALLIRLFYNGGLKGLLQQSITRDAWDGTQGNLVRSRTFMHNELCDIVVAHGLKIISSHGIPLLPLILGYLRGHGKIESQSTQQLALLETLLKKLAENGLARRCHVILARLEN